MAESSCAATTESLGRALALSVDDAAAVLSVSRDSFERHVMAEIHLLRVGRRVLVPVSSLDRAL